MQHKAFSCVLRSQDLHGIARHFKTKRDLWQRLAGRPAEPQLPVGLSIDLIALLVNGPMVPAAEHGEIRECRRTPLSPVADVMALPEPRSAAREAAAAVSVVERPP